MVFIVRKQPSALGQLCMCHHPASALPQPQPLSLYPPPSRALALSAVDALHKTLNPQLPHSVLMLQAPNAPCSLPSYNTYEAVLQNWVNPLQHIKGSDILILFMWKPAVSQLNLDSDWRLSEKITLMHRHTNGSNCLFLYMPSFSWPVLFGFFRFFQLMSNTLLMMHLLLVNSSLTDCWVYSTWYHYSVIS